MEAGSQKLKKACRLLQQTTVNYSDRPQRHKRVALTGGRNPRTHHPTSSKEPANPLQESQFQTLQDTQPPHQHPKVVHPRPNGRVFMPDSGDRHTVRHSQSKSPGLHKKHLITNRVKQTRNNICFK